MTTKNKIDSLARLGDFLLQPDDALEQLIISAPQQNAWFTPENTRHAITATGKCLTKQILNNGWGHTQTTSLTACKSVGLVLAGNIPMVGFHDILCVLASGNKALIKLSSQDQKLIPFILNKLVEIEPAFEGSFEFIERLAGFDAVIATGSGNTSRYFEYYFKNVPHIIRREPQ